MMNAAIIFTVLALLYTLVGLFFITLNAPDIARARNTFCSRWRYAVYCTFAWPWVKVNKQ